MIESRVCPECRTALPADAPGGLCPRCLMGVVVEDSQTIWSEGLSDALKSRPLVSGPALVDFDRFKRSILNLGLIRDQEFDRLAAGLDDRVLGLAEVLVKSGKLTAYQASALLEDRSQGLVIGNYFILDELGAGGMGIVFKARHRRLGRVVALKTLLPSMARDPELLLRFRREVDVAARLSHPNLVSVLDADEDRGVQFMTLEFIPGKNLAHLVRDRGVLPVDLALDCVIQAARGLEAAHDQGIVHRDIKPANLMLDDSGVVRVLDLGLARLIEAVHPFGETLEGSLTLSGTYMGTVDFMAPEQGTDSRRVDHRADIYSLGCTLCYLLTGRSPFEGKNVLSRLMAHQDQAVTSLIARRPDVPEAIDAAYQKMMAKKPDDRPGSMIAVIELLESCRKSSDQARSGLQAWSTTITWQETPTLGSTLGPEKPSKALIGLDQDRIGSTWPRVPVKRRISGLALGGLALLILGLFGLLGYFLISTRPGPSTVNPSDEVDSIPDRPIESEPIANRLNPEPRSSGTLERSTLYIIHGEDHRPGSVESIAVTADGHRVLIGSWTEYAELINVDTGKKAKPTLGLHNGWQGATPSVAMTPDGRFGLIGTQSVKRDNLERLHVKEAGILWFWDLKTGHERFPHQQPYDGPIHAVAISPDGLLGLTASKIGELTLWDLSTGQRSRSLLGHRGSVSTNALAFFPDGHRAASGGQDKLVHLWDLDTGREIATCSGHDKTISGLAISADGRRIVTASHDASVILWDAASHAILHRFSMPHDDKGARVVFDSTGNIVAAGNGIGGTTPQLGHLIVWDVKTYAQLHSTRPTAHHLAVAALPDGRILTGDRDGLRLWTIPKAP